MALFGHKMQPMYFWTKTVRDLAGSVFALLRSSRHVKKFGLDCWMMRDQRERVSQPWAVPVPPIPTPEGLGMWMRPLRLFKLQSNPCLPASQHHMEQRRAIQVESWPTCEQPSGYDYFKTLSCGVGCYTAIDNQNWWGNRSTKGHDS